MPEPGMPRPAPLSRPTIRLSHDYSIVDSDYKDLTPLDRSAFDKFGAQANDIYGLYDVLMDWLKMPYIKDDCANHDERTSWLETMDPEQKAEMKRNKLTLNSVIPIYHIFDFIPRLLKAAGQETLIPSLTFPDHRQDMALLKDESLPLKRRIDITKRWERSAKHIVDRLEAYAQGTERVEVA